MKSLLIAAALALGTGAVVAQEHKERCDPVPKAEWRPQAELEKMLIDKGWKVTRVKIVNGCYEVYGRDAKNAKKEVFFHPKTLQVVTAPE